ncbi:NAD(P)-binding Rossmann-fold superfamily protein [Artemisia annua]|uniref:NAD(P)-binding Rossmann-fold superfamily protein n=1 Tax=Artemisia annua TaxID=35608 RepID=A0A2U1LU34_ARTAN|nr:NAD(P)-binding Rossmann-fold superfamily protein [Artemisia annua]
MEGIRFEVGENLEFVLGVADVVSCASNSEKALVLGKWLKAGTHLDLVAKVEVGELDGAFERGVVEEDGVEGDLVELIKRVKIGRKEANETTVVAFNVYY